MTQMEKVIKGLEEAVQHYERYSGDEYGREFDYARVEVEVLEDALELLKAQDKKVARLTTKIAELTTLQEPRVLTLEEALHSDYCWLETNGWKGGDCFIPVIRSAIYDDDLEYAWLNCDDNIYGITEERYGKTARCWTSRPDDERRQNTPWE